MTVNELIALLQKFDGDLPVYIGVWEDRHPFGGDGTDLSCYEPELLEERKIRKPRFNAGFKSRVDEEHVYIDPGW